MTIETVRNKVKKVYPKADVVIRNENGESWIVILQPTGFTTARLLAIKYGTVWVAKDREIKEKLESVGIPCRTEYGCYI
jgi:hypothetical protein